MLLANPLQFIVNAIYLLPAIVIGIVGHEVAHAAVAVARGDQTPRVDGRLSLNPRQHLDPLGTLAAFFIYFGWGRPLRLNPYRMRNSFDPALVWIAGPLASFLIAIVLSIPLKLLLASGALSLGSPPVQLLLVAFYFNTLLAVVNIIPIPGLDGYNLLGALFRRRLGKLFFTLDTNRQVILLVVIVILIFAPFVLGASVLDYLYTPIAQLLLGSGVRPVGF
ncbi:MAG TPA: site-2 protease family protein [Candidatus Dormibacteraeota bacterium]|nr:site-2 protease family protein [Candidatus Dormibacteraeota bacterium]